MELLARSGKSAGATTTGYGDHPTDIPFLRACDRGVLVQAEDHELKDERYPQFSRRTLRARRQNRLPRSPPVGGRCAILDPSAPP